MIADNHRVGHFALVRKTANSSRRGGEGGGGRGRGGEVEEEDMRQSQSHHKQCSRHVEGGTREKTTVRASLQL